MNVKRIIGKCHPHHCGRVPEAEVKPVEDFPLRYIVHKFPVRVYLFLTCAPLPKPEHLPHHRVSMLIALDYPALWFRQMGIVPICAMHLHGLVRVGKVVAPDVKVGWVQVSDDLEARPHVELIEKSLGEEVGLVAEEDVPPWAFGTVMILKTKELDVCAVLEGVDRIGLVVHLLIVPPP